LFRRYNPGDIAVITPQNLPQDVDAFLEQMHWSDHANKYIEIHPSDEGKRREMNSATEHSLYTLIDKHLPHQWPKVMTFRDLFVKHLDIFAVPRRSFFEMLSYFVTNEDHVERLQEFISPEGQVLLKKEECECIIVITLLCYRCRMICGNTASDQDVPLPKCYSISLL
jgi:sulfite reductase alpha subunit-like flavoprotein